MKHFTVGVSLAIAIAGSGWGQSFEVATVKPAPPPDPHFVSITMSGGPGSKDPERLRYSNVTIKGVLTKAFGVKSYQISGPAWLGTERFDITAKVPAGATKEQFALMLQNLLAERFGMAFHREKKELPAFALVIGKGGPKFQESKPEAGGKDGADAPPPPPLGAYTRMPMGKDGLPQMPPGRSGTMNMSMTAGKARMSVNGQTMGDFVEMLSGQIDRPIVDMTALTGKYDFSLTFEPEKRTGPMGMMMPPGDGPPPASADGELAPNVFTAVQEQLGLKLEPKKSPIDLIVIDKIEKTPTDN